MTPPSTHRPVIDADAHIIEPADLWTSRLPRKHLDVAPRVEQHPSTGHSTWRIGDTWVWPVGQWAPAGWPEFPPSKPWEYEDIQHSAVDNRARLERMDEYGLDVQILYPNIIGFQAPLIAALEADAALDCTRAYNDWLLEWCSADPKRLIPIAMLPYWDREESVREAVRCAELGFRGVLFANKFERVGLPRFGDPYWDPVYATVQELGIPVNFHIGFTDPNVADGLNEAALAAGRDQPDDYRPMRALLNALVLVSQCQVLGELITSGVCERFPDLDFVSVETGFGHIPFYLEGLDWQWKAQGNTSLDLLPSEYFARQCYGTFWYERASLRLLDLYPDNFMFSTDYPHPSSLAPGPASPADHPVEHIEKAFSGVDPLLAEKALAGNARRVYRLDA